MTDADRFEITLRRPRNEMLEFEDEEEHCVANFRNDKLHRFHKILLIFFPDIISFQHVLHFYVGTSQIKWYMKMKSEISVCTAITLKHHSNPYVESITVLSDYDFV